MPQPALHSFMALRPILPNIDKQRVRQESSSLTEVVTSAPLPQRRPHLMTLFGEVRSGVLECILDLVLRSSVLVISFRIGAKPSSFGGGMSCAPCTFLGAGMRWSPCS